MGSVVGVKGHVRCFPPSSNFKIKESLSSWLPLSSMSPPYHISWPETWQHLNRSWELEDRENCVLTWFISHRPNHLCFVLFCCVLFFSWSAAPWWIKIDSTSLIQLSCGDRDIKEELRMKTVYWFPSPISSNRYFLITEQIGVLVNYFNEHPF